MTLLPIVARELRVASRSRGYYWGRFLAALVSIGYAAYLTFVIVGSSAIRSASAGGMLFTSLAWMGLFFCIGSVRTTTDCISEEKREGTLGLLFLTDLKGYDVILGKLFAHSVRPFYGLMATVPVICCALVMGGLTLATVCRTVLALLNIFFLAQSAGLLVSTLSRDRQRATAASVILLGFFFLVVPGVVALMREERVCFRLADFLELFGGAEAFTQAQSGLFAVPTAATMGFSTYWPSLLALHLTGWIFLALASLAVPRSWQDRPVKTKTKWSERMRQWCFGPPEVREALRRHLLEINPFLWLISRNRLGQAMVWATLGFIGCGWVWIWFLTDSDRSDVTGYTVAIAIVNHTLLKFWLASEAGGHLAEQRRSGALEYLLCCTPLSVDEIIGGQWLALRRRFLRPVIFVVAVDLIMLGVVGNLDRIMIRPEFAEFATMMTAGIIMLVADVWALGWVAMWQAMIEKKPRTAAGSALVRIVVLPWLIMGIMAPMEFFHSPEAVGTWWFILGIGFDLGFGIFSRENLLNEFRAQAALRPEETLGFFGRIGRHLGQMYRG
jgi:hypothetical protein